MAMMSAGAEGREIQEGRRPFSVIHFLIALVVWFAFVPFVDQFRYGDLVDASLLTLVLLSAVPAVGGRHWSFLTAMVLVAPALVAAWIDHFRPGTIPKEFVLVTAIVFVAFIVVHLFFFILRARWVNTEVLCAAVSAFLMLGILGACAYLLVALLVPNSFVLGGREADRPMTMFEALYFSMSALTHYPADIKPLSRVARMLQVLEATAGLFYMAVLISRLVSHYSRHRPIESTRAS
jgi:hypothetical protein